MAIEGRTDDMVTIKTVAKFSGMVRQTILSLGFRPAVRGRRGKGYAALYSYQQCWAYILIGAYKRHVGCSWSFARMIMAECEKIPDAKIISVLGQEEDPDYGFDDGSGTAMPDLHEEEELAAFRLHFPTRAMCDDVIRRFSRLRFHFLHEHGPSRAEDNRGGRPFPTTVKRTVKAKKAAKKTAK
jgi:hypothetical protein